MFLGEHGTELYTKLLEKAKGLGRPPTFEEVANDEHLPHPNDYAYYFGSFGEAIERVKVELRFAESEREGPAIRRQAGVYEKVEEPHEVDGRNVRVELKVGTEEQGKGVKPMDEGSKRWYEHEAEKRREALERAHERKAYLEEDMSQRLENYIRKYRELPDFTAELTEEQQEILKYSLLSYRTKLGDGDWQKVVGIANYILGLIRLEEKEEIPEEEAPEEETLEEEEIPEEEIPEEETLEEEEIPEEEIPEEEIPEEEEDPEDESLEDESLEDEKNLEEEIPEEEIPEEQDSEPISGQSIEVEDSINMNSTKETVTRAELLQELISLTGEHQRFMRFTRTDNDLALLQHDKQLYIDLVGGGSISGIKKAILDEIGWVFEAHTNTVRPRLDRHRRRQEGPKLERGPKLEKKPKASKEAGGASVAPREVTEEKISEVMTQMGVAEAQENSKKAQEVCKISDGVGADILKMPQIKSYDKNYGEGFLKKDAIPNFTEVSETKMKTKAFAICVKTDADGRERLEIVFNASDTSFERMTYDDDTCSVKILC